ncbi:MAG TPA: tetratricopeptide repeat protein [Thermoanaerobaculia bacterium]|nr:tetratricopeptide repeat protein [Thermoanaerobaculia bacterium]
MSQRLTRKDMKRDDFANAVGRSVEYAESHGKNILLAVAGAVVLVAIGVGVYFFLAQRSTAAEAALGRAIKVYAAPVGAAAATAEPGQPSFPDEAARRARAKQLFTEVRDRYGLSQAGAVAAVYLGRIAAAEGKFDEARQLWTGFVDHHGDNLLAGEVRVDLMDLDRRAGKGEELVGRLRPMLDDTSPPLPKDVVLYELAVTYEQLQRKPEAVSSYQRILDEFPQSPYRQEAQQKLVALEPSRAGGMSLGGTNAFGRPPGV